ncbi:MAG: precorrin-6A synthase (deacetylating) [Pseudoprimorskyibacter sp.]|nr:precorrin-6A synthase (deacetylating) [Pseudoprimorskyibacter sp.]
MQELWLVGIGTGNPAHITLEGQQALRDADVVLIPRKGRGKDDLALLRHNILNSCGATAQVVEFDMPVRDEALPYQDRVADWHDRIAQCWQMALPKDGVKVALLVWGDPGLYDSTLRIAARLHPVPSVRVVPGITALQALTAAHAIPFNTIDGAVTVTTGRRLRDFGWPEGTSTLVVMLDGACSFQNLQTQGVYIWWGAYLGMPEQILVEGPLAEATPRIIVRREAARADHGWIMDTYLMRRRMN